MESKEDEARVTEHPLDGRRERAERQTVAGSYERGRRAVFGAETKVSGAEHDCDEPADVERHWPTA
jgi:hypothetical protein